MVGHTIPGIVGLQNLHGHLALLQQLSKPMTIDDLWEYYKEEYSNKRYSTKFSFDQYIMALDYLFIIGAIEKNERGLLCYETDKFNC